MPPAILAVAIPAVIAGIGMVAQNDQNKAANKSNDIQKAGAAQAWQNASDKFGKQYGTTSGATLGPGPQAPSPVVAAAPQPAQPVPTGPANATGGAPPPGVHPSLASAVRRPIAPPGGQPQMPPGPSGPGVPGAQQSLAALMAKLGAPPPPGTVTPVPQNLA